MSRPVPDVLVVTVLLDPDGTVAWSGAGDWPLDTEVGRAAVDTGRDWLDEDGELLPGWSWAELHLAPVVASMVRQHKRVALVPLSSVHPLLG